jgi:hypothetical protein
MRYLAVLLTSSLVFCAFTMKAAADDEFYFEPANVTVSGLLLGNFVMLGSGDMIKGHILHLKQPINITGNGDSSEARNRRTVRNVNQILLEFSDGEPSDELAGANVEVRGKLYNKPSGPHHTKVTMIVEGISVVSVPEGDHPVGAFKTH